MLIGTSGAIYGLQILAGLGSAAGLFLVASGLTLIFGALRVVNFAHGSLYMIGASLKARPRIMPGTTSDEESHRYIA